MTVIYLVKYDVPVAKDTVGKSILYIIYLQCGPLFTIKSLQLYMKC